MIDLSNRAFIFDMDGTLVDNMNVHTEAWAKLLDENGVEMDRHKFLVATAGKTNREILPTVFGDISAERISELAKRKETLYREAYLPIRKPVEGLVEFLSEAQKLGIKMAVATAASNPNMEFILDGLDLRRFFGAVTTATDVAVGKPDPAMFLVSAQKLGVQPFGASFGHVGAGAAPIRPPAFERAPEAKPGGIVEPDHTVGAGKPHRQGRTIVAVDDPAVLRDHVQ